MIIDKLALAACADKLEDDLMPPVVVMLLRALAEPMPRVALSFNPAEGQADVVISNGPITMRRMLATATGMHPVFACERCTISKGPICLECALRLDDYCRIATNRPRHSAQDVLARYPSGELVFECDACISSPPGRLCAACRGVRDVLEPVRWAHAPAARNGLLCVRNVPSTSPRSLELRASDSYSERFVVPSNATRDITATSYRLPRQYQPPRESDVVLEVLLPRPAPPPPPNLQHLSVDLSLPAKQLRHLEALERDNRNGQATPGLDALTASLAAELARGGISGEMAIDFAAIDFAAIEMRVIANMLETGQINSNGEVFDTSQIRAAYAALPADVRSDVVLRAMGGDQASQRGDVQRSGPAVLSSNRVVISHDPEYRGPVEFVPYPGGGPLLVGVPLEVEHVGPLLVDVDPPAVVPAEGQKVDQGVVSDPAVRNASGEALGAQATGGAFPSWPIPLPTCDEDERLRTYVTQPKPDE